MQASASDDVRLLEQVSYRELKRLLSGSVAVGYGQRRKRDLIQFALTEAPKTVLDELRHIGLARNGKKRKRNGCDESDQSSKRMRMSNEQDPGGFMSLPTIDERKERWQRFYDKTSNAALSMNICAVCGREMMTNKDNMVKIAWSDFPGKEKLLPLERHPSQRLLDGCLLCHDGIDDEGGILRLWSCPQCLDHLRSDKGGPPALALANGLWVGEIPIELQGLTIPEQQLLGLVYLRMCVFKLYPKTYCGEEGQQRAIRGSLSTYALNTDKIAAMVEGRLMPRPVRLLPCLISVLYVGPHQVPKEPLKKLLRVRRRKVHAALLWLKNNNPKYYGEVEISDGRLDLLPEDDVPEELLAIVRKTDDESIIDEENGGYVPMDEDLDIPVRSKGGGSNMDPDVIPLDLSGIVDGDLHDVSANDMMSWAVNNVDDENPYAVRHGSKAVSTFGVSRRDCAGAHPNDIPNFFEKAFPGLFPYGYGGIEAPRRTYASFRDHIRWAMQYHDRRFRTHETFPLVAFAILQRREAMTSAKIRIKNKDAHVLRLMTMDKLKRAAQEEGMGRPISDPEVRRLKKYVQYSLSHVVGCNEVRQSWRSQIWSTNLIFGPPTVWVTINPCDIHDPIAQVFAGEHINMDDFPHEQGPNARQRAKNIASDPYAASKFFHFMVETVLETLLGVKVTPFQVVSEMGVLGEIAAYFGAVESQGRGTLHLHCLLWLKNTPSADEIPGLLRTEEFRRKVQNYIKSNIRAYLPGLDSEETVRAIPTKTDIAFSRPPNPNHVNYDRDIESFELQLARAEQIHVCKPNRCLRKDNAGRWTCKRRAPFPCNDDDYVTENGDWGCKRQYGYVNAWNPDILINARCNNDVKILTHGRDARNITFYVTSYATKNQPHTFNSSALGNGYRYHITHPTCQELTGLQSEHQLLLLRLMNAATYQQEIAAPLAVAYLMGQGDVYRSHLYSPIYWSSFVHHLKRNFPADEYAFSFIELRWQINITLLDRFDGKNDGSCGTNHGGDGREEDVAHVCVDLEGGLHIQSQVEDYIERGAELEHVNVLDFLVSTYEEDMERRKNDSSRWGRRRNDRVCYREQYWKAGKKRRVKRMGNHRHLPNVIGRWFPPQSDESRYYCASMLLLLKPWRDVKTDLKMPYQSWQDAFGSFIHAHPEKERIEFILAGIQFYHDCSRAGTADRNQGEEEMTNGTNNSNDSDGTAEPRDLEGEALEMRTEEAIGFIQECQISWPERQYAQAAIDAARSHGIFHHEGTDWTIHGVKVRKAQESDLGRLKSWKDQMRRKGNESVGCIDMECMFGAEIDIAPTVEQLHDQELTSGGTDPVWMSISAEERGLGEVNRSELNDDQGRAFDIVEWHLKTTLAGRGPPPLRMIVYGEGGTGKSKLIQTISALFRQKAIYDRLQKTAYTGIAASLIDGQTMHSLCRMSIKRRGKMTVETRRHLQETWEKKLYLIIDECSMISKTFLQKFATKIKQARNAMEKDDWWGGLNVILCGDFHQFPPVAVGRDEYLFTPTSDSQHSNYARSIGRKIYEEFSTVIILTQQRRVCDDIWLSFLRRLRTGTVLDKDIKMLRSLILSRADREAQDEKCWEDLSMITPRHMVRMLWNQQAVREMCRDRHQTLFICRALDSIDDRPLTARERLAAMKFLASQKNKCLSDEIEMAIGMKVLVTYNVETDLDITNGARGTIMDIILDPREQLDGEEPVHHLQYLPIYILVQLERTRIPPLSGLEERVIPIEPMSISIQTEKGRTGQTLPPIHRTQYPITGAYAFTDYRSQGQTIKRAIIDIGKPPHGTLTLFNLYVALSRCPSREHLRLLRDFNAEMLMRKHDGNLLREDQRLDLLDSQTRNWWAQMSAGQHGN